MDLHIPVHSGLVSREKDQMLELNRRLRTYLGRVEHLEAENSLLAQEIRARRLDGGSAPPRNTKEDLHRARNDLEEVWRWRTRTQMEVSQLTREMEIVKRRWQMEARAREEIGAELEVSARELEEELGAQNWLRGKMEHLEGEMVDLLHNHEKELARLEAARVQSVPARFVRTTPDLLQLEQELSQRASVAWKETAEAYQAQLDRLQVSLMESVDRLDQMESQKNQFRVRLEALEGERLAEMDARMRLEGMEEKQRREHGQHLRGLQGHLDSLEKEKRELAKKLELLLEENRGLFQEKMSMGLEVVTYRALLDSENLRPIDSRNHSFQDAKASRGNYQAPRREVWRPPITSTTSTRSKFFTEVRKNEVKTTEVEKQGSFCKMEAFREQDVVEKVTCVEPGSSQREEEREERPVGDVEEGQNRFQVQLGAPKSEEKVVENENEMKSQTEPKTDVLEIVEETFRSLVDCDQESPSLLMEDKAIVDFQLQVGTPKGEELESPIIQNEQNTQELKSGLLGRMEDAFSSSAEGDQDSLEVSVLEEADVDLQLWSALPPLKKELTPDLPETISSWLKSDEERSPGVSDQEKTAVGFSLQSEAPPPIGETDGDPSRAQEQKDDGPGTETSQETTPESRTSSRSSQSGLTEISQEVRRSILEPTVADILYPDGEDMDTWDSVMEKKVRAESSEPQTETGGRYAEPEEDISARRSEPSGEDVRNGEDAIWQPWEDENPAPEDGENVEDEDEDSQNVSVSWRTELESDSYAQEKTLADTRPLIRYTSDETDANTLASHESDASDGEHDGKAGDTLGPGWGDSRAKNFGTMEDLCEEVEEEVVEWTSGPRGTSHEHLGEESTDVGDESEVMDSEDDEEEVEVEVQEVLEEDQQREVQEKNVQGEEDLEEEVLGEKVQKKEVQEVLEEKIQEKEVLEEKVLEEEVREDKVQMEEIQEKEVQEVLEEEVQEREVQKVQEEKVQGEEVQGEEVQKEGFQEEDPEWMNMEGSEVRVEHGMDLRDSEEPQGGQEKVQDGSRKLEEDIEEEYHQELGHSVQVEEKVQDVLQPKDQKVMTESGNVFGEVERQFGDVMQPELDMLDVEKIQDGRKSMEQENLIDPEVQVEDNLVLENSIPSQLMTPDFETKDKVEMTLKPGPKSDLQAKDQMDLELTDDNLEKVQEGHLKQEEGQMASSTEWDLQLESDLEIQPRSNSPNNDSLEDLDLDVQVEDLQDSVLPQVLSPDDDTGEIQNEILTQEEAQKVYLLSSEESHVQEEHQPTFWPRFDSAHNEKKVQDEFETIKPEESNCKDLDLNLGDLVQPMSGSPDDSLEEVRDGLSRQEDATRGGLPVCKDSDLQLGDLGLAEPHLETPDHGVLDGSLYPEEQELGFSILSQTFSEFLSGPDPGEAKKQKQDQEPESEPQNPEGLHLGEEEEERIVPWNTVEDFDVDYPETEEESVDSQVGEDIGDGDTLIFPEKDSPSRVHQTKDKENRDFWVSSLEAAAGVQEETPEVHDVDFETDLGRENTLNGGSAHRGAVTKLHSRDLEVEGESWSSGNQ
ncbi:nestin [Stigmatopora nigra]